MKRNYVWGPYLYYFQLLKNEGKNITSPPKTTLTDKAFFLSFIILKEIITNIGEIIRENRIRRFVVRSDDLVMVNCSLVITLQISLC